MSYYAKGHQCGDDDVNDFEEYDPTPYGGGYDIALTYGRQVPHSEETCYPNTSSTSDHFDYDRPQYTSSAEPCAYADEALENEYKSYTRRKTRPGDGYGHEEPQPNNGFQSGTNKPGGYGGEAEFGSGGSEYQSGYGQKTEHERPGSGYGGRSEYEKPSSEYRSGYGGRSEHEKPSSEYGSGYGRKSGYEETGSEYGSGYGKKSGYEEPVSEYVSGYERKPDSDEYGSGYGRKASYEEEGGGYGEGERAERTEYGSSIYGKSEEEEGYKKPSYERRADDEEEGYGRKKYGNDDSDDEEKRNKYHHHHHHRKHSDDE